MEEIAEFTGNFKELKAFPFPINGNSLKATLFLKQMGANPLTDNYLLKVKQYSRRIITEPEENRYFAYEKWNDSD